MYKREDGEEIIAEPGSYLYSTVTMFATHHWYGGSWKPILEETDDDSET